jgi:hypothetical protein
MGIILCSSTTSGVISPQSAAIRYPRYKIQFAKHMKLKKNEDWSVVTQHLTQRLLVLFMLALPTMLQSLCWKSEKSCSKYKF